MVPLLSPLTAIAIGANLGSTLFGLGAERAARKRREEALRRAADVTARRGEQAELGGQSLIQSQSSSVRRRLVELANSGILNSSFAAPAVTEAAAPFEMERQRQVDVIEQQERDLRLAADVEAAAAPGFSDFAGAALGELGGFAALRAGQQEQSKRSDEFLSRLERIFQQQGLQELAS